MASQEELREIDRLLSEINRKYVQLSEANPFEGRSSAEFIRGFDSVEGAVASLNTQLRGLQASLIDATSNLTDVTSQINSVLEGLGEKGFDPFNQSVSSAKKLRTITNQLSNIQDDIVNSSVKDVKNLQRKADLEFVRAQRNGQLLLENLGIEGNINSINIERLINQGLINEEEAEALALAQDQGRLQEGLNNALAENLRRVTNINKATGLTGKLIGGLGNSLNKLGFGDLAEGIKEAQDEMKALGERLTDNGDKAKGFVTQLRVLSKGLGILGKNLLENLTDPLVIIGLIVKGFKGLINLGQKLAGQTADIGKNFQGLGSESAAVAQNLREIAADDPFLSIDEAISSFTELNNLAGTQVKFTKEELKLQKQLSHDLGLGAEQAAELYRLSVLTGGSSMDVATEIGAQVASLNQANNLSLNQTKILEDVLKLSSKVRFNLASNPKALTEAVFQARRLGLSLDEIQGAAESTLEFESSIEKQLNAQLLLGKAFNLEKFREAALAGDSLGQTKELSRLIKESGGDLEGNVIKQRAFADMLGISVDQVTSAIEQNKLLDDLSKKGITDRAKAQQSLQILIAKGYTQEQAFQELSKGNLQSIIAAKEQSEVGKRAIEDLKDIVTAEFAPLALKLVKGLSDAIKSDAFTSFKNILKSVLGFVANNPVKSLGLALGSILLAQKMIPQAVTVVGGTGFFGKGGGKFGKLMSKLNLGVTKLGAGLGLKGLASKNVTQAVMKSTGKTVTGAAAKSAVKAGSATVKGTYATSKLVTKSAGKALGKSLLKKIPVVGALAGIGFGLARAAQGDYLGALGEVTSGLVSLIPGIGTAASVAIDAGLAVRDINNSTSRSGTSNMPPPAADFISRPGQPVQRFRADDVVVGGTNLTGGGNTSRVEALLERLIDSVEKGGVINMDGTKVGTVLGMASYRTQ